jgi:transposase
MRVEVLGGIERRRRWSRDEKMRIIEETLAPGAVVTEVARRHGLATSLVFTWRRQARAKAVGASAPSRFVPVRIGAGPGESAPPNEVSSLQAPTRKRRSLIEIRLGDGKRVSVDENVDVVALARVLDVLVRR